MKKMLALLIGLVMLFSFAAAEPDVFSFAEMISEEELAKGTYEALSDDIPVKIWVMNGAFRAADISEVPEAYATGLEIGIFKFIPDENRMVILSAVPDNGGSFDDFAADMKANTETSSGIFDAVINGIRAIVYETQGENGEALSYFIYEAADDVRLSLLAVGFDDELYDVGYGSMPANAYAQLIVLSVAPAE